MDLIYVHIYVSTQVMMHVPKKLDHKLYVSFGTKISRKQKFGRSYYNMVSKFDKRILKTVVCLLLITTSFFNLEDKSCKYSNCKKNLDAALVRTMYII